jgi:hypothetical protein
MLDTNHSQAAEHRRYDLIAGVNRGWRKAEMDMLGRIGALDSSDNVAVALMAKDFRKLLTLSRFRLVYETEVHAALDQRRPGASGPTRDHGHVAHCMGRLEALLGAVEAMKGAARRPALRSLYLRFSEAIALDFDRMAKDEQIVHPLLEALFTDEELAAIEQRAIAQVPEEVLFHFVRIITPALDPEARDELVSRMRRYLPGDRFAALMRDVIRPALTEADLSRLDKVAA